jgi:hypothetical protein
MVSELQKWTVQLGSSTTGEAVPLDQNSESTVSSGTASQLNRSFLPFGPSYNHSVGQCNLHYDLRTAAAQHAHGVPKLNIVEQPMCRLGSYLFVGNLAIGMRVCDRAKCVQPSF